MIFNITETKHLIQVLEQLCKIMRQSTKTTEITQKERLQTPECDDFIVNKNLENQKFWIRQNRVT